MADNDATVAEAEVPAKPAKKGKGKRAKKKAAKKSAGTGRARGGAGRDEVPKALNSELHPNPASNP